MASINNIKSNPYVLSSIPAQTKSISLLYTNNRPTSINQLAPFNNTDTFVNTTSSTTGYLTFSCLIEIQNVPIVNSTVPLYNTQIFLIVNGVTYSAPVISKYAQNNGAVSGITYWEQSYNIAVPVALLPNANNSVNTYFSGSNFPAGGPVYNFYLQSLRLEVIN